MKMILLSEFFEDNRRSELYLEKQTRSFWVVALEDDREVMKEHFLMRGRAEDWAEDWVSGRIQLPDDNNDSTLDPQ